ncbi:MAG: hypothetical protein QXW41_07410 [Fervidicoccaceae archaeon]
MPVSTYWGEYPTQIDEKLLNKILRKYNVFSRGAGESIVRRFAKPWHEYVGTVLELCEKKAAKLEQLSREIEREYEELLAGIARGAAGGGAGSRLSSSARSASVIINSMVKLGCIPKVTSKVPYRRVSQVPPALRSLGRGRVGAAPEAVREIRGVLAKWRATKPKLIEYREGIVRKAREEGLEL